MRISKMKSLINAVVLTSAILGMLVGVNCFSVTRADDDADHYCPIDEVTSGTPARTCTSNGCYKTSGEGGYACKFTTPNCPSGTVCCPPLNMCEDKGLIQ
jgi:hypothetical protein